jgi:hypothetical protein
MLEDSQKTLAGAALNDLHLYRNELKIWFLAASAWHQIFGLHPASSRAAARFTSRSDASQAVGSLLGNHCRDRISSLAIRQWSHPPDTKIWAAFLPKSKS